MALDREIAESEEGALHLSHAAVPGIYGTAPPSSFHLSSSPDYLGTHSAPCRYHHAGHSRTWLVIYFSRYGYLGYRISLGSPPQCLGKS